MAPDSAPQPAGLVVPWRVIGAVLGTLAIGGGSTAGITAALRSAEAEHSGAAHVAHDEAQKAVRGHERGELKYTHPGLYAELTALKAGQAALKESVDGLGPSIAKAVAEGYATGRRSRR